MTQAIHKEKAVALLSSGLDSSVALAMARADGWEITLALTLDYGQRAKHAEQKHAAEIAGFFGVKHEVVKLPWFSQFQRSGLLSADSALPHPSLSELSDPSFGAKSAKAVWVPNRNGVFLEVAAGFAEDSGATAVIVGFNREEAATFPDNSVGYLEAINKSLSFSTANGVQVISPTAELSKSEIVAQGLALEFPFELLWSCYEERKKMCGQCESCMRLKRALAANEVGLERLFENAVLG